MLALLFVIDIATGPYKIGVREAIIGLFDSESPHFFLLRNFRFTKAVVALLTGVALSASGLQMQTLFRNPLADPYVLGVSSGAGLGAALFIMGTTIFPVLESLQNFGLNFSAWMGAAVVLLLVLAVSIKVKDVMAVLILGVMFGSAIAAIINILQYFSPQAMLKAYVIWTMGSLGSITSDKLPIMVSAIGLGLFLSLFSIKSLNALLLGENYARSMGVNIRRSRNIVFAGTCILAGTITAFCGPIGFIGIAVPHLTRMLYRTADHKILMPAVMLMGGVVMLFCDIVSQSFSVVLPINSITALLGIPIVILVIFRFNNQY